VEKHARHVNSTERMPWIVIDAGSRYGMIDDHDRMNVPAHPGCPVQNPESRKTVSVCVYAWCTTAHAQALQSKCAKQGNHLAAMPVF